MRKHDPVHQAWIKYDAQLRALFPASQEASSFEQQRFAFGVLSLPPNALAIITDAERVEFTAGSSTPGFHTSDLTEEIIADVRACSHFRVISGALENLLADCVAQLRSPVAAALGTPWSILNMRAWTTPPSSKQAGMYSRHRDGFPWQIFKIMIYFTPMDEEHGGLEIEQDGRLVLMQGPAGSWVLFYNSAIPHRGASGKTMERACAEITLTRTTDFDMTLHQAGLNAHFPLAPPPL
jgi:hypothetical protein